MKFLSSFNDYARQEVPSGKTSNWFRIGTIIVGVGIAVPIFIVSSLIGNNLGLVDTIIATYAAALIITIIACLAAVVGSQRRLSTYIIIRKAFGTVGAKVVAAVVSITLFGWFGVTTELFATSSNVLLADFGINISIPIIALVGGILMMLTAILGFKALDKLSILSVPLLLILILLGLREVFERMSLSEVLEIGGNGELSLGVAISIIAGSFMVGAVIMPDLSRYARNAKHAVGSAILGYFIGFPIVFLLTSVLAIATQQSELIPIFTILGFGIFAFIVLILAAWTSNDNNLYSASLGLVTIFEKTDKWKIAAGVGIIGTLLAVFGILSFFIPWLLLLGILIPPIGGIYIMNHFFIKEEGESKMQWSAFISWILAALFAYSTTASVSGGLGLFVFTTIPALDSIIVSSILYIIIKKVVTRT